ncbi:MAG: zinc ribbon domain-containing protein [Pyrinomonadaceae bacterium]
MFCPQCGSSQNDELKFCKTCGANLHALRRIMASRDESDEKFDWSKTWVAEMFMSGEESVKQQAKLERLQGITPEVKRRNEIKAGVITASAGIALMLVLSILMEGIIISGRVSDVAAEILSRIWIVGVIPLLVGAALIFNGIVVSKKSDKKAKNETEKGTEELGNGEPGYLSPADTSRLASTVPFSVTDETTQHLKEPIPMTKKAPRKN